MKTRQQRMDELAISSQKAVGANRPGGQVHNGPPVRTVTDGPETTEANKQFKKSGFTYKE